MMVGVLLAAGASRRMGRPKALALTGPESFRILATAGCLKLTSK